MSEAAVLSEVRPVHETGSHYFRKVEDPFSTVYYGCACGALADRYGEVLSTEASALWVSVL